MGRFLPAFLAITLACSSWLNYRQAGRLAAMRGLLARRDARIVELKERLLQATRVEQSVIGSERERVAELQRRLSSQRETVDEADRRLQIAENQGLPQNDAPRIQARLENERELLSELDQQLRAYKVQGSRPSADAHDALARQGAERQILARIAVEKENARELKRQLQAARATVQSARDSLSNLRDQDRAERQKLRNLQDQLQKEKQKLALDSGA